MNIILACCTFIYFLNEIVAMTGDEFRKAIAGPNEDLSPLHDQCQRRIEFMIKDTRNLDLFPGWLSMPGFFGEHDLKILIIAAFVPNENGDFVLEGHEAYDKNKIGGNYTPLSQQKISTNLFTSTDGKLMEQYANPKLDQAAISFFKNIMKKHNISGIDKAGIAYCVRQCEVDKFTETEKSVLVAKVLMLAEGKDVCDILNHEGKWLK